MPGPKLSREEIDRQYEVYDRIPMSTPDAWGDLQSFITAKLGDVLDGDDVWDAWPPECGGVSE